jgi:hypothetical protein
MQHLCVKKSCGMSIKAFSLHQSNAYVPVVVARGCHIHLRGVKNERTQHS